MYCRCREPPARSACCRCHYQREIIPCRCQQRCVSCRCEKKEEEPKPAETEKKEVKTEPPVQQPVQEEKKEIKRSKWPYWRCVQCQDGKVRFLKTNKCPIPRRGYSLQRNPNCKCNKGDIFEPYVEYVYEKPKKQPKAKKAEPTKDQKKTENENKSKAKESKENDAKKSKDDDKNKKDKKHKERHHSKKRRGCCCCSHQVPPYRPACCCQMAHTSSRRCPSSCQRPVTENMCCKCRQAELAKLCRKKVSYDCIKTYTETGESKFVCKKKKKPKDPCENMEEYALLLENGTVNPCDGPTQIIIVADPKCNDTPAIELFPIDPFTPLPPCECSTKQRQNEPQPSRRGSENARSSLDAGNKSIRPSLDNSRKSVETTARTSLETDKKKKKK